MHQSRSYPIDSDTLLALAYGAFARLGWSVPFAGPDRLIGYTEGGTKKGIEVLVQAGEGEVQVTGKVQRGYFRKAARNRAALDRYWTAFEETRTAASPEETGGWTTAIEGLRAHTLQAIYEEEEEQAELEGVMKQSYGSRQATYVFIALNVGVAIAMLIAGVPPLEPTVAELLAWGANYKMYTTGGQGWRLITCAFVHVGAVHLLFNMYALYTIGNYLEPMLGRSRYVAAYLATAVIASLTSIWWHKEEVVSAGASGAVFGLFGVFLALLTTSLIPARVRKSMLQGILIFVAFNLVYGLRSGIDNAAHLGGLLSGMVLGYIYYPLLKRPRRGARFRQASAVLLVTSCLAAAYLISEHDDTLKFQQGLEKFRLAEQRAMSVQGRRARPVELQQIARPAWDSALQALQPMLGYELNAAQERRRDILIEYTDLRLQENVLLQADTAAPDTRARLAGVRMGLREKLNAADSL